MILLLVDSGKYALGKLVKLLSIFLNSTSESKLSNISLNISFSSLSSAGNPILASIFFLQFPVLFVKSNSEIVCQSLKSSIVEPGNFLILETSCLVLTSNKLKKDLSSKPDAAPLKVPRYSTINSCARISNKLISRAPSIYSFGSHCSRFESI